MQDNNLGNFQDCLKCNICAEVCPMMEVNPLYPGPKQAGPDELRYRIKDSAFFDNALKYCLNCKRCEVACPSGVKVGDIVARAKIKYGHSQHKMRDLMLSSTDLVGGMATTFAPIVNLALSLDITKSVLDSTLGVSAHASMPKYASKRFEQWFKKVKAHQEGYSRFVEYFHGCYVNYNYPQLGQDFVTLMNACGYGVHILEKQKCCGVALIANGFASQATSAAKTNLASIRKASQPVLTTSSSCTLTIKEEYSTILDQDTSDIQSKVQMAVKWLYDRIERGEVRLAFRKDFKMKAAYHTPCHLQKLGNQIYSIALLRMIPGLDLKVLEQKCCGISGTFGFKKENYAISQKIGSQLYERIYAANPEVVITDCETCKWQIEGACGIPVFNPISILVQALDIEQTTKLNER
ncbi:MAG: anaerobic glycerol-3-phosphate dehydrogenase subunit GlpC [Candidatus Cryptobacteroides sp.]|nr:anaerobic glycerol-3-phosphate dehydrogenase subunit GlpC [Bacteroidales bacterium]MDY5459096.1 anaerobic glycerol-3-phosphate dehydrogenase subunit GlpC [Candidatus Cryptobacteroides sp.]